MKNTHAFVGDVHGNATALHGLVDYLVEREIDLWVFLGDYVNKGPHSKDVLELLVTLKSQQPAQISLLAGNHDIAMLDALESGSLTRFLKIGGASTIRDYVGQVSPSAHSDFKASVPESHLALLKSLEMKFEDDQCIAQHNIPNTLESRKFRIGGHRPVGKTPRISPKSAEIDTGCGSSESGRLTAFLWPTTDWIQVDSGGISCPTSFP